MQNKGNKEKDKFWVEIEVNKFTEGLTVFRGRAHREDIEAWARGDLAEGAFKLEDTYWYLEGSICYLGKGNAASKQYTGDTYIRTETIMTILVLHDDSYPGKKRAQKPNVFPFPGREV